MNDVPQKKGEVTPGEKTPDGQKEEKKSKEKKPKTKEKSSIRVRKLKKIVPAGTQNSTI